MVCECVGHCAVTGVFNVVVELPWNGSAAEDAQDLRRACVVKGKLDIEGVEFHIHVDDVVGLFEVEGLAQVEAARRCDIVPHRGDHPLVHLGRRGARGI